MKWCYDERYFERELYFDRKIELFEVSRSYKELRQRLKSERVKDDIEYLPCDVTSAANDDKFDDIEYLPCGETGIAADDNNDEIIIYLIVTNHTKGDLSILDGDKLYDVIIWNNPVDYYGIVENYENLKSRYIDRDNVMYLIKNELCRRCLLYTSRCV